MGLPFKDIVTPRELPWSALSGRAVAVDAYNALYQFLATIRQADGQPFSDAEGLPTSHLMGSFYRTTSLLAAGVRPVWVFDGKPPERKAGTIRQRIEAKERATEQWHAALAVGDLATARRKAAQTSRLTPPMVEETIELLDALGVPTVRAPSEGEAQAARMAADGVVWATASEDYDTLLFGAPRLVRGLAARRSGRTGGTDAAQLIDREEMLRLLHISGDELILIGILVGTDFNDGVRGYGPKRALKIVQEHLGWAETIARTGLDPIEADEVAEIFRHPNTTPAPPLDFRPPDPDRVAHVLVRRHGFSEERVRSALQRVGRAPTQATPVPTPPRGRQQRLDRFEEVPS
ncbi:MAG: flap endonuclease-1 [Candidatus Thermoplasmatota archaeon]|nr:flap endonuclease-1 [Candidatus Thermoplasmatota archaeon]MCL5983619.1 flap endonuclease-1 [Candidatus Thermoplasmatota archaeon]